MDETITINPDSDIGRGWVVSKVIVMPGFLALVTFEHYNLAHQNTDAIFNSRLDRTKIMFIDETPPGFDREELADTIDDMIDEYQYATDVARSLCDDDLVPGYLEGDVARAIFGARAGLIKHNNKLINAWTKICVSLNIDPDSRLSEVLEEIRHLRGCK